ncbi:MAG: hypothetical protein RL398_692 [Planctomycetota bacterium]
MARTLRGLAACGAALAVSFLGGCGSGGSDALLQEHRLSYDGNGSTHGSAPASVPLVTGTTAVVSQATNLERPGYEFTTWNDAANGSGNSYLPGALFLMGTADVTLYAQWQPTNVVTYSVTYHGNGNTAGTVPTDSGAYETGQLVTVAGPNTLANDGYLFDGWNTLANGSGVAYTEGATFVMGNAGFNLYAQWTPEPTVTVTSGDGQLQTTWPEVANATEYRVYYGTTDDVGAATLWNATCGTISSTSRTATITGLTNTTAYYVWVAGMVSGTETFVNADSATGTPATGTLSTVAQNIAPSDNALEVALDKTIVVPFNLPLDADTVDTNSVTVASDSAVDVNVAVGISGDTIEITPVGGSWGQATMHTVTIADTVTGSSSETMGEAFVFTFTTIDNSALIGRWTWNNAATDVSGHNLDANVSDVTYDAVSFHEGTHALTTAEGSPDSSVDVGTVNLGEQFAYSAWIKLTDNDGNQAIFANGTYDTGANPNTNAIGDGIRVYVEGLADADRIVVETGDGTNGVQVWTGTIANLYGSWHHLVVSVDRENSDVRIYLDGEEQGLVDGQFSNQSHYVLPNFGNTGTLRFNCMEVASTSAYPAEGNVDDLRLYARLIGAGEARNVSREN